MSFSLIAKFGMDASGVKTELKQLRSETNDFVNEWGKIGLAAAGAAFLALSKGAMDLAGSLSDASANIGINVISLQALQAQHKLNGVSNEMLVKALEKTKQLSVDVAAGDMKAAEALAKLGISAEKFIALPLDRQYEAIAKGAASAKNQSEAYGVVGDIFGTKVGPKLMGSLKELADVGLPGVTESARESGKVMETETIAALDRAGDAIDDFKQRATIAVGNIIVNFSSAEGLKLLLYQFLEICGKWAGAMLDVIKETNDMLGAVFTGTFKGLVNYFRDAMVGVLADIASAVNKILPSKFEINVANIEAMKSAGKTISDEITEAIAKTTPSTFRKDIGDSWSQIVKDQQEVVDKLNNTTFGEDAKKLEAAGEAAGGKIKASVEAIDNALHSFFGPLDKLSTSTKEGAAAAKDAAKVITDAQKEANREAKQTYKEAAQDIKEAAREAAERLKFLTTIGRTGTTYEEQSTTALSGVRDNLKKQLSSAGATGTTLGNADFNNDPGRWFTANFLKTELAAVEKELKNRSQFQQVYDRQGADAALRQYGDSDYQRMTRDLTSDSRRTANALERLNAGLRDAGFLPL